MTSATKSALATAALMVALLVISAGVAEGQGADCAAKLVPCAEYLNSSKPSAECCNAIKQVVSTQLPCLCNLVQNPGLLNGINITQALEVPKHCNLSSDTSVCKAQSPSSSVVPPPRTRVPGNGNDNNGGSKSISFMGVPSLLLLLATLVFQ